MATEEEDDQLLEELKQALKPDPPGLKKIKESGKAAGKKLPGKKS